MTRTLQLFALLVTFGAFSAVRFLDAQQQPAQGTQEAPHAAIGESWAIAVLAALGNEQPSAETIRYLEAWHRAEGGTASYNWLNSTQRADGATDYNSVGVKNYPSYESGVQATSETLTNGFYPRTLTGLVSNQPIVDDAEMGTWGTGGGAIRAQLADDMFAPQASTISPAYLLQGDVGVNVRAALNANGGALQDFVIAPGATWSFGHSIAPISAMGYLPVVCGPAGCNAGGGWCDLSAEYVKVADQLRLRSSFPPHAGVSDPRFPGILIDEHGDGGDLTITNTLGQPVRFQAYEENGTLIVTGGTE